MVSEDFQSNLGSFAPISTPFTTGHGFGLVAVTTSVTAMQIVPNNTMTVITNGTQFLHFRDFTAGLKINLPFSGAAFGFDYGASDAGWQLTAANGISLSLPGGLGASAGFIGYVDVGGTPFSSFTLTGPAGAQRGLSIDNIAVAEAKAIPEPGSLALVGLGLAAAGAGGGAVRRRGVAIAGSAPPGAAD